MSTEIAARPDQPAALIDLVDLYEYENRPRDGALEFLYELMIERQGDPYINISHTTLPAYEAHVNFVLGKPYRAWMLIVAKQPEYPTDGGIWVGYVSATRSNEIGIILRKRWRGRGFGPAAVRAFINRFAPLGAIPSGRSGTWLANINPKNRPSIRLFEQLGFNCAQATYRLDMGTAAKALENKPSTPALPPTAGGEIRGIEDQSKAST